MYNACQTCRFEMFQRWCAKHSFAELNLERSHHSNTCRRNSLQSPRHRRLTR